MANAGDSDVSSENYLDSDNELGSDSDVSSMVG